jgi:hypothetical protein
MELCKIEGGKTHLNHVFKKKRRSKKSEKKDVAQQNGFFSPPLGVCPGAYGSRRR